MKSYPTFRPVSALLAVFLLLAAMACTDTASNNKTQENPLQAYFKSKETGVKTGGIKIIPIETPKGTFKVWTKTIGNNPTVRLLLLNGGPGGTHECFEGFESFLPAEGIELIYYDQLGCGNSDNPNDTAMWDLPRYVEEVEQVRKALNLTPDNFYLLGHSWGGMLAMQYALKYQSNLKGLIISNMMASCPAYGKYAADVLSKQMPPEVLAEIREIEAKKDFANPRYMGLLNPHFYEKHIVRMPQAEWPDPMVRMFSKMNQSLYVTMQGPSEFGVSGKLEKWDVTAQLKTLTVPTLTVGAQHDTMDPEHMKWISNEVQNGSFLYCPNGSHCAYYDDQETYMAGLIKFLKAVDAGKKKGIL
jgi:proline iminopeptidase